MTNAELIDKLRILHGAILNPHHRGGEYVDKRFADVCVADADALEADEKRIAGLERILKAVQENSGINFRLWQEAETQMPKEGEWIEQDDGDSIFFKCSVCGKIQYNVLLEMMQGEYHYCPNCGARMKGEQE